MSRIEIFCLCTAHPGYCPLSTLAFHHTVPCSSSLQFSPADRILITPKDPLPEVLLTCLKRLMGANLDDPEEQEVSILWSEEGAIFVSACF